MSLDLADDMTIFANTDEFGESFSYIPSGGGSTAATGIVVRERWETDPQEDGIQEIREARIIVSRSAWASPSLDDEVSLDGLTWQVVEIIQQDAGATELRIVHVVPVEWTRPGHRVRRVR